MQESPALSGGRPNQRVFGLFFDGPSWYPLRGLPELLERRHCNRSFRMNQWSVVLRRGLNGGNTHSHSYFDGLKRGSLGTLGRNLVDLMLSCVRRSYGPLMVLCPMVTRIALYMRTANVSRRQTCAMIKTANVGHGHGSVNRNLRRLSKPLEIHRSYPE